MVTNKGKGSLKTAYDPKVLQQVDKALSDISNMGDVLSRAKEDMTPEEARLEVHQLYARNLRQFADPVAGAVGLLAELKTRADLDRVINPEQEFLSDKYLKVLDEMRKTLTLVEKFGKKEYSVTVQKLDDEHMVAPKFIDVDAETV